MKSLNRNVKEVSFDIVGQKWIIQVVDSHDPHMVADGAVCRGCTWVGQSAIYMSNELTDRTFKRVLLHELVHAYLFATQMSVPDAFNEEQLCDFFAIYSEKILDLSNKIEQGFFIDEDNSSI